MFDALKTAISILVEDAGARNRLDSQDGRLATASLLIRVATVTSEMSVARHRSLHAILKSGFGLDDPTTVRLIDNAAAAERNAIHFPVPGCGGAAACVDGDDGVAAASWTTSPFCRVSGGLSIIRS
jgi:hypothetical protein